MQYPTPSLQLSPASTERSRQRIIAAILAPSAAHSDLFASPRAQHYLAQYQRGRLTIDEVVYYLEATVLAAAQR